MNDIKISIEWIMCINEIIVYVYERIDKMKIIVIFFK